MRKTCFFGNHKTNTIKNKTVCHRLFRKKQILGIAGGHFLDTTHYQPLLSPCQTSYLVFHFDRIGVGYISSLARQISVSIPVSSLHFDLDDQRSFSNDLRRQSKAKIKKFEYFFIAYCVQTYDENTAYIFVDFRTFCAGSSNYGGTSFFALRAKKRKIKVQNVKCKMTMQNS